MKAKIVSLFLSLAFLSILIFESTSSNIILENSSLKTVEYILEKKLADKFMDDTYLLNSMIISLIIDIDIIYKFKKTFYTFKGSSILLRPPISL